MAALSTPPRPTSVDAIAARLRATREALDLNQSQFASGAGIAKNTYNMYEAGNGRPELDKAIQLCERYGLTLDWIYRGIRAGLPYYLAEKLAA
jgi:transcriptional regulator with XRE-family HTH domain